MLMPEITASENICKNCNHTFTKHYCNGCGQKKATRITTEHLAHEVMHATLHADKGIFPFISRLILSPGLIAREYIDGKRKIFNPVQFLMLSIGFVIALMSITHFYENVEIWQSKSTAGNSSAMQQKLIGYDSFIKKNGNILVIFLIPIFAFFGKMVFSKQNHNYAEHIMLSVFVISLSNILTGVMLALNYFVGLAPMWVIVCTLFITIFSFFLTYKQFYQINWFKALWKSIIMYSLAMIAYMILTIIIMVFILFFT